MSINVKILGGGEEIGKNAIEVNYGDKSLLLDYGVSFNSKIEFPLNVNLRKLAGILVSHAHLDHVGALPLIYSSSITPTIYFNKITAELMRLLLYDFLKISKENLQFDETSIEKILEKGHEVPFKHSFEIDAFSVKVGNAGHIPGSWVIGVEAKNKKILYTGDFNVYETELSEGAEIIDTNVDLLICESTYACINHINRNKVIDGFIEKTLETLDNKGTVLIPSFSVGRSQEILCILKRYNINYPIYLDGMARKASNIMLKYPEYFKNYKLLQEAHSSITIINNERDRKKIANEPSIIISPAGMLKGGPAIHYIKKVVNNEKNSIIFVGYLAENTPARKILENRILEIEDEREKVKAKVYWFSLSSHSDMKGIIQFVKKVNPQHTVFIHGEPERTIEMANLLREQESISVSVGKNGETFEL